MANAAESLGRHFDTTALKNLNLSEFKAGQNVIFFNSATKKWEPGELGAGLSPANLADGVLKMSVKDASGGAPISVETKFAPRVVELTPPGTVGTPDIILNGKNVTIGPYSIDEDNGEVSYEVLDMSGAVVDRISEERLDAIFRVDETIEEIDKVILKVNNSISAKHREVLSKLQELKKIAFKLESKLNVASGDTNGGFAEMSALLSDVKRIEKDTASQLIVIDQEIAELSKAGDTADKKKLAEILLADFVRLRSEEDDKFAKEEKKYNEDLAEWKKYDIAQAKWANGNMRNAPPPVPAGTRPTTLRNKLSDREIYKVILSDITGKAGKNPDLIAEVDKRRLALAKTKNGLDAHANVVDFTGADKDRVDGEMMEKAVAEWSELTVPAVEFKLGDEKAALEVKAAELLVAVDKLPNNQRGTWSKKIEDIDSKVKKLTKSTAFTAPVTLEYTCLDYWKKLSIIEAEIFGAEARAQTLVESQAAREKMTQNIEIPATVVMKLVESKPDAVKNTMTFAYTAALELAAGGPDGESNKKQFIDNLKTIFDGPTPSDDIMKQLRKHGIKDWGTFTKIWKDQLAEKIAPAMLKQAEAQITRDVLGQKMDGVLSNVKNILGTTWSGARSGAVGPMAKKIAVTMACVGGGALLLSGALVGGAALGLIAAGGTFAAGTASTIGLGGMIGGFIRRAFAGGKKSKEWDEKSAQGVQNFARLEKERKLKRALNDQEVISEWTNKFSSSGGGESQWMLSAAISSALESPTDKITVKVKEKKIEEVVDAKTQKVSKVEKEVETEKELSADYRTIYYTTLKKLVKETGIDPEVAEKAALAGALYELQVAQNAREAKGGANRIPGWAEKIVGGFFKHLSGKGEGKLGYLTAATANTIVAEVVFANSSLGRLSLGALGGGLGANKAFEHFTEKKAVSEGEQKIQIDLKHLADEILEIRNDATRNINDIADEINDLYRTLHGLGGPNVQRAEVLAFQRNSNLADLARAIIRDAEAAGLEIDSKPKMESEQFANLSEALAKLQEAKTNFEQNDDSIQDYKRNKLVQYSAIIGGGAVMALVALGTGFGARKAMDAIKDLLPEVHLPGSGNTAPSQTRGVHEALSGDILNKSLANHPDQIKTVEELIRDIKADPKLKGIIEQKLATNGYDAEAVYRELHPGVNPPSGEFVPAPGQWHDGHTIGFMGRSADTVDTFTMKKNFVIWDAANKITHNHKYDNLFQGMSSAEKHAWVNSEIERMGIKSGGYDYPFKYHPGTKMELVVDSAGKPHLRIPIENNHVELLKDGKIFHTTQQAPRHEAEALSEDEVVIGRAKTIVPQFDVNHNLVGYQLDNIRDGITEIFDTKGNLTSAMIDGQKFSPAEYAQLKSFEPELSGSQASYSGVLPKIVGGVEVRATYAQGLLQTLSDADGKKILVGNNLDKIFAHHTPPPEEVADAISHKNVWVKSGAEATSEKLTPGGKIGVYDIITRTGANDQQEVLFAQRGVPNVDGIRLLYNKEGLPVSYFDKDGGYHKLSAEIMQKILAENPNSLRRRYIHVDPDKISDGTTSPKAGEVVRRFADEAELSPLKSLNTVAEKLASANISTPDAYKHLIESAKAFGSELGGADKKLVTNFAKAIDYQGRIIGDHAEGLKAIINREGLDAMVSPQRQGEYADWLREKVLEHNRVFGAMNNSFKAGNGIEDIKRELSRAGMRAMNEIQSNSGASFDKYVEKSEFTDDLINEFRRKFALR